MSLRYIQEFKVKAKGKYIRFPIDMLRYDRCSPATETDSNKLYGFMDSTTKNEPTEISLVRFVESKSQTPTARMLALLGWRP